MSITDKVVKAIRSDLSDIATDHEKNDHDLYRFVGVDSSRSYNFVIDAFYLLEDTQLAKSAFQNTSLSDQDFGTLYLLYYGVFNACYMQQQATLVICREIGISQGLSSIRKAEIVNFRNSFSAHSPNRGKGSSEHSYILDRHAMRVGSVEGYSANHNSGQLSLKGDIFELLNAWNKNLDDVFLLIGKRIYGDSLLRKI